MAILKAFFALLLLMWPIVGIAEADAPTEYQVKAAFLYHFAQFTEWPSSSFSDDGSPFRICVFGKDPFGSVLEEMILGKRIKDREILLRRLSRAAEINGCHILFVSLSEGGRLREILRINSGILTVGETEGFTNAGGIVKFFISENKVRFEINAEAARRSGLSMSSKLLKLGTK